MTQLKRLTLGAVGLSLGLGLLVVFGGVFLTPEAHAQERFVTQSAGRGLQDAKTNARVSKAESDIEIIFADLDDIEPFARQEILTCSSTDNKLRWTGTVWSCDSETDPTVQAFAKSSLPTCGAGTSLSARNNRFECVEDTGLLEETDPTVMDFAKTVLPNCGSGQVLTTNGSNFSCVTDDAGLTVEVDPTVKDFAKSLPPACGVGQVLKSNGQNLFCVSDDAGITVEVDPAVYPFARNDQDGYTFEACETDYILTTNAEGTELTCVADQGSAADQLLLGDLGDVDTSGANNNLVLMYDSGTSTWYARAENDPNVQAFARTTYTLAACAAGQVLSTNGAGTELVCITDAGGSLNPPSLNSLSDVALSSPAGDEVLRFDGTNWVNSDDNIGTLTNGDWCQVTSNEIVCDIDAPSACAAGQVLQWNGSGWQCDDAGSTIGGSIRLTELEDVTAPAPANDDVLRFTGAGWVNSNDKIGTLNAGDWCTSDGSEITCTVDAPVTCTTPDVIRWDGSAWSCVNVSSGIAGSISLTDLSDVNVTGATNGQVLQYNGATGDWEDVTLSFIAQGDSQVVVSDSGNGAVQIQTDGAAAVHIDENQNVGIGDITPDAKLDVVGDVIIEGNLAISGTLLTESDLTVEGVTFSQGGISATGSVSATTFYGDGSNLTGVMAESTDRVVSDTTSIIAYDGSDRIDITTGGTQQMVIDGDGILLSPDDVGALSRGDLTFDVADGIDTIRFGAPGSWAMDIVGSNQRVEIGDSTSGSNIPRFTVVRSGNVGISTTNPTEKLHVVGNGLFDGNLTVTGDILAQGNTTIEGVTFSQGGISATGDVSATNFYGDGSGLTNLDLSAVTAPGSDEQFLFNDNGTISATANVFFDNETGWVGIGTASPSSLLDVSGVGRVAEFGNSTNTAAYLSIQGRSLFGHHNVYGAYIQNDTQGLSLNASDDWGTVPDVYITTLGNVGISTTTPTEKLHVVGNGLFDGNLTVTGDILAQGNTTIEGVTFSQGGISATGDVSATNFYGDGSGLTNLDLGAVTAPGSDEQALFNDGGQISASSFVYFDNENDRVGIGTATPRNNLHLATSGRDIIFGGNGSNISQNAYFDGQWRYLNTGAATAVGMYNSTDDGSLNFFNAPAGIAGNPLTWYNRLSISSSGNVGIGTDSPSNTLHLVGNLEVNDAGNAGYSIIQLGNGAGKGIGSHSGTVNVWVNGSAGHGFHVRSNSYVGTSHFFVNTGNGNVGIGTTNPNAELEVAGTVSATGLEITGNGLFDGNLTVTGDILAQGNTTIEGVTFSQGGISATGDVSATNFYGDGSGLTNLDLSAVTAPGSDEQMLFNDNGTISATANVFFDNETGRVGIGTSNPARVLSVFSDEVNGAAQFSSSDDTVTLILQDDTQEWQINASGASFGIRDETGGTRPFVVETLAPENSFRIDSTGNIGISTTATPSERLHVVGNGLFEGNLTVTGDILAQGNTTIEGVTFSQGGISATGDVSATNFYGDGSGITGITGSQISMALDDLRDVTITTPATNSILQYDGAGWIDAILNFIGQGDSQVVVADSGTGTAQVQIDGATVVEIDSSGLETFGTVSATGLAITGNGTIDGNLNVTGDILAQGNTTIEGVTFSQGGVSVTGEVSATTYYGDGSNLTGVTAASTDRVVSGTTSILAAENASLTFTTAGTQRMIIDENGRVGIGTDSPSSTLHLNTSANGGLLFSPLVDSTSMGIVRAEDAGSDVLALSNNDTGSTNNTVRIYDYYTLFHGAGGAGSGFSPYASANVGGAVFSRGSQSTAASRDEWLWISYADNLAASAISTPGADDLLLRTNDVTRLTIESTGNIGIGTTTNISHTLTVAGDVAVSGTVYATNFVGDGSGLTNLNLSGVSVDRIVSGTTNITAAENASLTFTTAGAQRVVIGEDGDIGIGVSSPSQTLHVAGRSRFEQTAGTMLDIQTQAGGGYIGTASNHLLGFTVNGSVRAAIDTSGHVGIGTTAPSHTLHIRDATPGIRLSHTQGSGYYVDLFSNYGGAGLQLRGNGFDVLTSTEGGGTALDFQNGAMRFNYRGAEQMRITPAGYVGIGTATNISHTLTVAGDVAVSGTVYATNFVGDGSGLTNLNLSGVSVDRIVSGTTNITAAENASLTFTTAGVERMIVDENGNVGIGTASPQSPLHLHVSSYPYIQLTNNTTGNGSSNQGVLLGIQHTSEEFYVIQRENAAMRFLTSDTERMVIDNGGNVGIGTTTPSATLHVAGSISATETIQTEAAVQVANADDVCSSSADLGKIRFNAGALYVCR